MIIGVVLSSIAGAILVFYIGYCVGYSRAMDFADKELDKLRDRIIDERR